MPSAPVSFITVTRNGLFFTRLLLDQLRRHTRDRAWELIVVDQGSNDGTQAWAQAQPEMRLVRRWRLLNLHHKHGEAAEAAVRMSRYAHIVLLDSDAHPIADDWLVNSVDRLDDAHPLAGAKYINPHRGNRHGWYIRPHFMAFRKSDLGRLIVLRKMRGDDTDTGEEATIRVLDAGLGVVGHAMAWAEDFSVGHPKVPTVAGGVFHAWYVSRLLHRERWVIQETGGQVSVAAYMAPLQAKLRMIYGLDY